MAAGGWSFYSLVLPMILPPPQIAPLAAEQSEFDAGAGFYCQPAAALLCESNHDGQSYQFWLYYDACGDTATCC